MARSTLTEPAPPDRTMSNDSGPGPQSGPQGDVLHLSWQVGTGGDPSCPSSFVDHITAKGDRGGGRAVRSQETTRLEPSIFQVFQPLSQPHQKVKRFNMDINMPGDPESSNRSVWSERRNKKIPAVARRCMIGDYCSLCFFSATVELLHQRNPSPLRCDAIVSLVEEFPARRSSYCTIQQCIPSVRHEELDPHKF